MSERVRFDSHVSFIDATKLELEADRTRLSIKVRVLSFNQCFFFS